MSVPVWPPVAGTYAMRLTKGGVRVPVRIWFGAPVMDGEELDRSPRWNCEIDGRTTERGELLDIDRAWPYCAKEPIGESEYRYLVEHAAWARDHAPDHPKAAPRRAVNFNRLPMRF